MTFTATRPRPVVRPALVCVCRYPEPYLVRLFGCCPIAGAWQCATCGRRWVES